MVELGSTLFAPCLLLAWLFRETLIPVAWPTAFLLIFAAMVLSNAIFSPLPPMPRHGRTYLVTIPFSIYSELARWALQRQGVSFVEWGLSPPFHAIFVKGLRGDEHLHQSSTTCQLKADATDDEIQARRRTSLPLCFTPRGRVLTDSWEVAAAVESTGECVDKEIKALFDEELGPAARVLTHYYIGCARDCCRGRAQDEYAGPWHGLVAFLWDRRFPTIRDAARKAVGASPSSAEAARATCRRIFEQIGSMLGDQEYLGGSQPACADFAFAALSKGLVCPDTFDEGPTVLMPQWRIALDLAAAPQELTDFVAELRQTAAGKLALRMYRRHRLEVVGDGQFRDEAVVPPEEREKEPTSPIAGSRSVALVFGALIRSIPAYIAFSTIALLLEVALQMMGFTKVNASSLEIPMQQR